MASEKDFQQWAIKIRESDEKAFHALFVGSYNLLLRYALTFLRDEEEARDVLQEVYTYLWQIRNRIDENKSLKALLYHITRNRSLNQLGSNNVQRLDDVSISDLPSEEMQPIENQTSTEHELSLLIAGWIEHLPLRRREAFELSRFEGLDHHEIAKVMNCSPRTVNNHIVQALEYLREQLAIWRKKKEILPN